MTIKTETAMATRRMVKQEYRAPVTVAQAVESACYDPGDSSDGIIESAQRSIEQISSMLGRLVAVLHETEAMSDAALLLMLNQQHACASSDDYTVVPQGLAEDAIMLRSPVYGNVQSSGRWFFRDSTERLNGPFHSKAEALAAWWRVEQKLEGEGVSP